MTDGPIDLLNEWGSRERAVDFPHSFNVIPYLSSNFFSAKFREIGDLSYHYTDANALLNIARTNRFWATDSNFLNDPTEGRHGLHVAQDILRELADDSALGEVATIACEHLNRQSESDLFVVSLCSDGDLLSQWRGYGAFGAGYSLGFNTRKLWPHPQIGSVVVVNYSEDQLRAAILATIEIYREHVRSPRHKLDYVGEWLAESIRYLSQAFKHPSYAEESELRLVFTRYADPERDAKHGLSGRASVSYRSRGANVIPYLDTGIDFTDAPDRRDLPLEEVILGPGVPPDNLKSLQSFLRSTGHPDVKIRASNIPFKG